MPLSSFKPENYDALLQQKQQRLQGLLAPFQAPELNVYDSATSGFRMRAEFRFWHTDESSDYVMFAKGAPDVPVIIHDFPIAHPQINDCMQKVRAAVVESDTLRQRLFQIEFLSSLKGEILVSLIYHKKLDEQWLSEAQALESALGIFIIGRSRKQKVIISQDYIDECLHVNGENFHYQQIEGSFTQPNALINQDMLSWAQQHTLDNGQDLLELYCGNGNFTAVLAQNFDKVLATEISKTSVRSAEWNFERNDIDNVNVCRMSSEDFTSALKGERRFRRLQQKSICLEDYHFSTVLVDPPRAGLDDETLKLIQQFDHIVYISCNPETLCGNLTRLMQSHQIEQAAMFDQFPYTDHIETGLILRKR